MKKLVAAVLGLALLGACGAGSDRTRFDSPERVAQAAYRHNGPPAITLYTMINNGTDSGAHTSMMINASQRVIFDPAGTVQHPAIVERADVLYGITPEIEKFYARAHARKTYRVLIQRIEVPAEVAEQALQLAVANGAVGQAFCTQSTSQILAKLPGFERIRPTFFPNNLSAQFGELPGVTSRVLRENDDDDKTKAIAAFDAQLAAAN